MSDIIPKNAKIIKIKIISSTGKTLERDVVITGSIMKNENVTLDKILKILVKIDENQEETNKRLTSLEKDMVLVKNEITIIKKHIGLK